MRLAEVPQASLMACMETQTAADAPIEGAFRGAFTDHFCQVLQGQFEQVPQHEGRELHAPIFGQAGEIANGSDRAPAVQGSCGDPAAKLPAGAEAEALTAQQMVYRAHIKFLDTMAGAAGRLPAGAGPAGDRPGAGDRAWCSGRRSMLQRPPCWRNRQVLVGKRCSREESVAAGAAAEDPAGEGAGTGFGGTWAGGTGVGGTWAAATSELRALRMATAMVLSAAFCCTGLNASRGSSGGRTAW